MSKKDFPTQRECPNRILNVEIGFFDSVRMSRKKNEKRKAKDEKRNAKNDNQTNFTLMVEVEMMIWVFR